MKHILLLLLPLLLPQAAQAGAWTQEENAWQNISGLILSAADHSFGSSSPIRFRRALLQTYTEYGWEPDVTLFAATESAYVDVAQGGAPYNAFDQAVEGGLRLRLDRWLGWDDVGVVSLEASYRTAGAFNFAVSANRSSGGNGAQLRLLYGRSFKLWNRDAYIDLEAGKSFLSGGRPDETPFDVTAGLWLDGDNELMLQSFNLFGGANPAAGYYAFESHKLELSWVRRLSDNLLLQGGGFFSPAGNNALAEQGLCLSVWLRF
jgi:protein XagA